LPFINGWLISFRLINDEAWFHCQKGGAIMLHRIISQFLDYCRLAEFFVRSLQALAIRTNEFEAFLKILKIRSVKTITYRHLIDFVTVYPKSLYN